MWEVEFHSAFYEEFQRYPQNVQDNILAKSLLLETIGPTLGRPHVDTLKSAKLANLKELRLDIMNGVWRVAFAFDPERKAILLVAGDKVGKKEKLFYSNLIRIAERRFDEHLRKLK